MKTYRINLSAMLVIWSFGSFAFFMVPYYLDSMSADFFILALASEAGEFLANLLCLFVASCMDLRRALFLFMALVALGCLAMIFVVKHNSDSEGE